MNTEDLVVDEKRFEKFLKSQGIKYRKNKDRYELEKPLEVK